MVCIEAVNTRANEIPLAPETSHTMTQTLRVDRLT